jgi:hypothetical protein
MRDNRHVPPGAVVIFGRNQGLEVHDKGFALHKYGFFGSLALVFGYKKVGAILGVFFHVLFGPRGRLGHGGHYFL